MTSRYHVIQPSITKHALILTLHHLLLSFSCHLSASIFKLMAITTVRLQTVLNQQCCTFIAILIITYLTK